MIKVGHAGIANSREIGECTRVARMRSISVDGQGHYNPDRSEDLWGKAVRP